MIFGHLGVAALVRATQRNPGGTLALLLLCAASVVPDIVDLVYGVVKICSPYGLYSHTIPAIAIEAAVVGGIALLVTDRRSVALLFALVVPLHLAADFITMNKLVMPGGDLVGFRAFARPGVDFLVELPLILVGWWMLRRSGRGPAWSVTWAMLLLVIGLQGVADVIAPGRSFKANSCPVIDGRTLRSGDI